MLDVERAEVEADQLGFARRAARLLRRRGAAQGPAHAGRPPGRPGAGHHERRAVARGRRRRRRALRRDRRRCSPRVSTPSTPPRSAPGCTAPPPPSPAAAAPSPPAPWPTPCRPWSATCEGCVVTVSSGPPPSPHARDRGRPRGDPAQRAAAARARLEGSARARDDGGGQGRRLRARHGAGGPGRARGRRRVAGRGHPGARRWRCGRRATPAGCCAGWSAPGEDFAPLVAADVDVTASSSAQVDDVVRGAREAGQAARLQLKFDTGLSRNGAPRGDWLELVAAARIAAGRRGRGGDRPLVAPRLRRRARPPGERQPAGGLRRGLRAGRRRGPRARGAPPGQLRGRAAAARAARFDLVRFGIAAYGFEPGPRRRVHGRPRPACRR